ncbi:MAG: sensor histidine kinase, partial [Acidobacteriota bacterium]
CDRTRIQQVFQNLIGNAVKFMDKQGGEIRVQYVSDDAYHRFSVSDSGPGIEERHFDRIFKIFQTLTSRDEFESTGVGLALVKKIVEMYGGSIWVESVAGQGSTFTFTIPKASADEKQ